MIKQNTKNFRFIWKVTSSYIENVDNVWMQIDTYGAINSSSLKGMQEPTIPQAEMRSDYGKENIDSFKIMLTIVKSG